MNWPGDQIIGCIVVCILTSASSELAILIRSYTLESVFQILLKGLCDSVIPSLRTMASEACVLIRRPVFLPLFLAWYIAASACAMRSSAVSPCSGKTATPTLLVGRRFVSGSALELRQPFHQCALAGVISSLG